MIPIHPFEVVSRSLFVLAVTTALPGVAAASVDGSEDLGALLTPAPGAATRELSPEASPYTVEPGHVQIETEVAGMTREGEQRDLSIFSSILKVGVTDRADLQLVINPYQRSAAGGAVADGFGDTAVRVKVNLWGNDGGGSAFALVPFVKAPTDRTEAGNRAWEGGLVAPLGFDLLGGLAGAIVAEIDSVVGDDGRDVEAMGTFTVGRDLMGPLAGMIELATSHAVRVGTTAACFDTGLTYLVTDDLAVDGGVNVGLTAAADDLHTFVRVTFRR